MKKFVFVFVVFIIAFSNVTAAEKVLSARETAIDLEDIFEANQLGLGYNGGQISGSLYADFGTESLRFTVNILELGGSMFNNGEIVRGTTMPWVQGLPKFFVGAGYIVNDIFRLGIGYGGKISQEKFGSGYYANNASLFFQIDPDDYNVIKIGLPVMFGNGYGSSSGRMWWHGTQIGTDYEIEYTSSYSFENKNISALVIAPDIRWETEIGYLSEIRLAIPFGMSKIKSQSLAQADLSGTDATMFTSLATKEYSTMTVGVDLKAYLTFLTDPVIFAFVPRINYQMALEGNFLETDVFGGNVFSNDGYKGISGYSIEKPWQAQLDLAFEISTESETVYVWAAPTLRVMAAGGGKIKVDGIPSVDVVRSEMFYGLGYCLPIEATIRANSNLEINLGLTGEGSPFSGNPGELEVTVDGSVIWYF